jgi:Divergent InlB B-repeat domain
VIAFSVALLVASSASADVSGDPVVTVAVQGIGGVSVQPSNITCRATCTTTVSAGTEVTLTATPATGFVLVGWRDACAGVQGDACVLHPDGDTTATAVFAIAATTTTETTETTPTTSIAPPPPPTATTTVPATTAPPLPPPPTTTPPTTTTIPTSDPAEAVAEAVDKLPVATVAFNTPTHLRRNESATIRLLLSPETISIGQLEKRVNEAGEKSGAHVQYSSLMEATLASDDFDIVPAQDPQQLVAAGKDTEWLWDIKPKRTGQLRLYLTLFAFVDVAGQRDPYKVKTFQRTLSINVGFTTRMGDFVKGNWQWLWTAILVPVGLWVVRRRTKPSRPDGGTASPAS